ncbi:MAG: hypothetical protein SPG61_00615, partial [Arcanobacterium sp.]|nr:hypothetical protein [Arcanobacterium sp.]
MPKLTMKTVEDLQARRMIAQFLAPSQARPENPSSIPEVAQSMLATQGQNYAGGLTALAIRAGEDEIPLRTLSSHLDAHLADFSVIRTWSQRGTLHFLSAQNFWIAKLLGPRNVNGRIERYAERYSVTIAEYERAREILLQSCETLVSRDSLRKIFVESGFG